MNETDTAATADANYAHAKFDSPEFAKFVGLTVAFDELMAQLQKLRDDHFSLTAEQVATDWTCAGPLSRGVALLRTATNILTRYEH